MKVDYGLLKRFVKALKEPYAYLEEQKKYAQIPPERQEPYRIFGRT